MQFSSLFAAWGETVAVVVIIVALFAVVFVFPMFSNKKRQKQANALFDSAKVGAIVETVGGIIGKVIEIRETSPVDKEMVIETGVGDNKTTIVFDIRALGRVITPVIEVVADIPLAQPKQENDTAQETHSESTSAEQTSAADAVDTTESEAAPRTESEKDSSVQAQVGDEQAAVFDDSAQSAPSEEKSDDKAALTPSANSSKAKSNARKSTGSSTKKSK